MKAPPIRVRAANDAPVSESGTFVLYWMIAARRARDNFALDRAIDWARELGKPLLVFEPLRIGHRWASERHHQFVIDGMEDNAAAFSRSPVSYYPYVEPEDGAGKGLLESLAAKAAVIVTDEWPCFFLPKMVAAAAKKVKVRLEQVDSNGLLPLHAPDRLFVFAHSFRTYLRKNLEKYPEQPKQKPLARLDLPRLNELPAAVTKRWPLYNGEFPAIGGVRRVSTKGGSAAAEQTLKTFLRDGPEHSGLSPYLHYGHISAHHVARAAEGREKFLDELITWREIGFNFCLKRRDYDRYTSLPDWAQQTLDDHRDDPRLHLYSFEQFERAETHDRLWNAAQRELLEEGGIQNYLRMLWGKKILEWSETPEKALATMIELNNKYALDGRDPNSYSGIFWVLGRYDRPWPERKVFGKVRSMSSERTEKKLDLGDYLARYGDPR